MILQGLYGNCKMILQKNNTSWDLLGLQVVLDWTTSPCMILHQIYKEGASVASNLAFKMESLGMHGN